MHVIVNGQLDAAITSQDRGFQYGDGVFETLALEDSIVRNWALHWKRLTEGCQRLFIPMPDEAQIFSEIGQVSTGTGKEIVKIIISRGTGARGYAFDDQILPTRVISAHSWPSFSTTNSTAGIELFVCKTCLAAQPALAGIKHLNRLENVLARHEWNTMQYAEGIMCDVENNIIEGTMSNIFMVCDNTLITPSLKQCGVNGVMRQRIMGLAEKKGIPLVVSQVKMDKLLQASEVFVCNSIIGIWPVNKIKDNNFIVNSQGNTVTRLLQKTLVVDHSFDAKLDSEIGL